MFRILTFDQSLKIFAACVIIAPLADIAAVIGFFTYKASHGYGLLDFGNWMIVWSYIMTPTGLILTALGIIPYGIAILALRLVRIHGSPDDFDSTKQRI